MVNFSAIYRYSGDVKYYEDYTFCYVGSCYHWFVILVQKPVMAIHDKQDIGGSK